MSDHHGRKAHVKCRDIVRILRSLPGGIYSLDAFAVKIVAALVIYLFI